MEILDQRRSSALIKANSGLALHLLTLEKSVLGTTGESCNYSVQSVVFAFSAIVPVNVTFYVQII